VRCRALLDDALAREGFRGVMAFTLPEALWLHGHGVRDLLVAYPTTDRVALRALAADPAAAAQITLTIDSAEHLEHVDHVAGPAGGRAELRVCLDLDASWRLLGGRLRVGARRSPVHGPRQAAALAAAIAARPGVRLVGLLMYEAQIAGVGDQPDGALAGGAIRAMQAGSERELRRRRRAVVAAVRAVAPDLEFVNGGGTGSLERTARDSAVTELAAGSGLYGPALFDTYRRFSPRPAALFALPVVRRPDAATATLLGGGYPASGGAGADRLPRPHLPADLRLDPREGAGEVQTPVLGPHAEHLRVGDVVFFRHAKAGELCERFDVLHLLRGGTLVERVPSYRGEGQAFL
jgi:D-serine deaminase-like pyridoxal phosphate-dependent protein